MRPALYNKDEVGEALMNDSCSPGIIPPFFSRFLFPVMPNLDNLRDIVLDAFSLAFVSSSLLVFLGKKIANFHNYNVNSNQVGRQAFLLLSLTRKSLYSNLSLLLT